MLKNIIFAIIIVFERQDNSDDEHSIQKRTDNRRVVKLFDSVTRYVLRGILIQWISGVPVLIQKLKE
jgi:hypothetical protein